MIRSLLVLSIAGLVLAAQDAPPPHRGPGGPGGGPGNRLEFLTKALSLTDDQKTQIKPILDDQQAQMKALRDDTSLDREAKMPKMREIMESTDAKIKPILTADQQKKFDEMKQRGPGRGRRPGGPPPQDN